MCIGVSADSTSSATNGTTYGCDLGSSQSESNLGTDDTETDEAGSSTEGECKGSSADHHSGPEVLFALQLLECSGGDSDGITITNLKVVSDVLSDDIVVDVT